MAALSNFLHVISVDHDPLPRSSLSTWRGSGSEARPPLSPSPGDNPRRIHRRSLLDSDAAAQDTGTQNVAASYHTHTKHEAAHTTAQSAQRYASSKPRHSLYTMEGISLSPDLFNAELPRSGGRNAHRRSAHSNMQEGSADAYSSNLPNTETGAQWNTKQRRSLPFADIGSEETPPPSNVSALRSVTDTLNSKGLQALKKVAKSPRESRVWGITEVAGAGVLGSADGYKRFDTVSLRKLCFAAELRTFKRGQALCFQGKEQLEAMLIIAGTASCRVKAVDEIVGTWTRESEIPPQVQSEVLGEEVYVVHAGDTIGFWALVTDWGKWSASFVATSKVDVLCFTVQICKPLLQSFCNSFDWSTPLQVLQAEQNIAIAESPREDSFESKNSYESKVAKPDTVQTDSRSMVDMVHVDLQETLRGIPFFRQFEPLCVSRMIESMEAIDIPERKVLWDQESASRDFLNPTSTDTKKPQHPSTVLHVIMQGTVRVFRRAVSNLHETPQNITQRMAKTHQHDDINALWDRPSELLSAYGSCLFNLFPGDTFGGPSLSHDHTLIVDGGTRLLRIREYPQTVGGSEGVSIVFQQETLRRHLRTPSDLRTVPEKNQLLHILQQGFEFFRHVATAHASKLLDQARLRRFRKGDAIIKQGETANHVYIIINGMAVQYVSEAETIDAEVWQMWELHRFQSDFARLGDRVKTVYVGRSIGEQEVVEQTAYRSTILADDEVEVLEISYQTYHEVLWDLCDGRAIPTALIQHTLSLPPDERDKQDVDSMLRLLFASDFLNQFSQEMRRHLTNGMHFISFRPNSVIVEQGRTGNTLFLCISGSIALHKLASKGVPGDSEHSFGKDNVVEKYGSCTRVLGIGDSFGELAFVQGRTHPTTAFTRTDCVVLCIDREELDTYTVQRIQSFVSSPRKEVIDGVFRKPMEDRNENDVMLLINYMELNPFMKPLSYPVMIDCAHTITRQVGEPGYKFGEDGEVNDRLVCIVNRGSVLARPKHPELSISIKNDEDSSQTLLQRLHSYRFRYREKNDEYLFFGFLYQSTDTPAVTRANVNARFSRKVFAIDTNGDLTNTESIEMGTLTELGHVSEIHTLERMELPKFSYALNLGIRGENYILAATFRSECDSFIDAICLFHPYFEQRFAKRRVAHTGTLAMCLSSDLGSHLPLDWKLLQFKVDGDGEISYSSSQNPEDEDHWFVVGNTLDLLSSVPLAVKDKPFAMELVFNPKKIHHDHEDGEESHHSPSSYRLVLAALSKSERELWLDMFGMRASKAALQSRYGGNYGQEHPHFDVAALMLHSMLAQVVRRKRARKARAYQHLSRAATAGPRSITFRGASGPTSFVGYGSAFSFMGRAVANEDCEVLIMTRRNWNAIKKREVGQAIGDFVKLLGDLAPLKLATPRELTALALNAHFTHHFAGEVLRCDSLSSKHIHLVHDGQCTLRRARYQSRQRSRRQQRTGSVSQDAAASESELETSKCRECGGTGLRSGVVNSKSLSERVDLCPTCNGTGTMKRPEGTSIVGKIDGQPTDIATLRRLAILHESVAIGEDFTLYELVGTTKFSLLSLRKDQWDEIQNKRSRAGIAAPEPQASWLAEQQIANAHSVMEGLRRGKMTQQQERTFAKALSLEQRAIMAGGKEHSRRLKAIKVLLGGPAAKMSDSRLEIPQVKDKRDAKPKHCALAPPATVQNPFARGGSPRREATADSVVHESEVKQALLEGLLSTARSPGSKALHPVAPKTPRADNAASRGLMHMLTPRREGISLKFHRPHRLTYGNLYDLDPRQQRIFGKISTMLNPENFALFSTVRNFNDSAIGEPTVDMFAFFEALKSYDLLRSRPTDNAVYELRAVSKADAMRIYWKAVQEVGGEIQGGARLGIEAFHVAVRDVCKLLQVPLDGKPDGRATTARRPNQGQNGNDDFSTHLGLQRGASKSWLSPVKRRDEARDEAEKLAQMEIYALRYLAVKPM